MRRCSLCYAYGWSAYTYPANTYPANTYSYVAANTYGHATTSDNANAHDSLGYSRCALHAKPKCAAAMHYFKS